MLAEFRRWHLARDQADVSAGITQPTTLVLAANGNNCRDLIDRLTQDVGGQFPLHCKTPLGFMREEVVLFWPLLVEQMPSLYPLPLSLRPETEQALAITLWDHHFPAQESERTFSQQSRLVRDTLDLLQLAGAVGRSLDTVAELLHRELPEHRWQGVTPDQRQAFLLHWRQWCWQHGLLTYGLMLEFYGQYLLLNPVYQASLQKRYSALFVDDLDDYPAIAGDLFRQLRSHLKLSVFTFNPDGAPRLGLNADPDSFADLAEWGEFLALDNAAGLASSLETTLIDFVRNDGEPGLLPLSIQSIQTLSRASLLRETADFIIDAVGQGKVAPQEIAIIAPGLDEIARYSLLEILSAAQIPMAPLNEQRPLHSSPLIRTLLTLLALLYPGLGHRLFRDDVAEMLVMLSQSPWPEEGEGIRLQSAIDPVRAGLLADTCYVGNPDQPQLLPATRYARWDRFGYRATQAYQSIYDWIETTKQKALQLPPLELLHRAIKELLPAQFRLTYAQLSELQALLETTQHFWEVQDRLHGDRPIETPKLVGELIDLLYQGIVSANPRPHRYFDRPPQQIMLTTIYQYRCLRTQHRWQIWLDAGDALWEKGGASQLYAAPLFQRRRFPGLWTEEEELKANQARFERIIRDLLGRASERLILCHSDFGVRGTEQSGALLALVQRSQEVLTPLG